MFYWVMRILSMPFYRLFYRQKIYGKENLPEKEPFVIVSNHYGKAEVFMLSSLFHRKIYFLAKKEWFSTKFGNWFFRKLGAIPVDRDKADFTSIKTCLRTIKDGNVIIIFPEGTRNKKGEGEMLPLKSGAAFISYMSGVQVVPVMMSRKLKAFRRNYVLVGEPFDYSEYKGKKYTAELGDELTEIMKEKMNKTLAEARAIEAEKRK